ncbi:MAG: hypothetical protein JOY54_10390 [Acidobacteriaceae bacterium]|nr:hypothetical protein [Acidobacteriaceae bacterium]
MMFSISPASAQGVWLPVVRGFQKCPQGVRLPVVRGFQKDAQGVRLPIVRVFQKGPQGVWLPVVRGSVKGLLEAGLAFLLCACIVSAQSLVAELKMEPNPQKRSDKALLLADEAFDNARDFYHNGEVDKGDAQLENMTNALKTCVESLNEAHKGRLYKKAEMNVATLQRRLQGLLDDLSVQKRGWAEYTSRKLDEIHDKLLAGVMSK